jgi:hypothetical protein
MTASTKYAPRPRQGETWEQWAERFVAWSEGSIFPPSSIKQRSDPMTVQLPSKVGTGNVGTERAITPGILLWDPVNNTITVSDGTVWKLVQLQP